MKKLRFLSSSFLLLLFFCYSELHAQTIYSLESTIKAQAATQEELPFWMCSNQKGRIGKQTNFMGLVSGAVRHSLPSGASFEIAAGAVAHDGFESKLAVDEAYAEFLNSYIRLTAGIKHQPEEWRGLSATNDNILWSLNSRALPGIAIATSNPVNLFTGVSFEALWAEYLLEEQRHVPWARVHRKYFHLIFDLHEDWRIKAGIQHFAQWGGTSPDKGKQPAGVTDYFRIITGRQGGEEALQGDIENSLGNHLGSWELEVERSIEEGHFTFVYNSIFEDGSGSRLANFPDGRYGLFWTSGEASRPVMSLMYEFYYTRHQSHDVNRWGADNYLNHMMTYNSGWTYFGKTIGAPFFLYDEAKDAIINNKFTVHHLGIEGDLGTFYNSYPYKLLLSYRHNEGTYRNDIYDPEREPEIFSTYLESRIFNADFDGYSPRLRLNFIFSADFNNLIDPNFGTGLSLEYLIL